MVFAWNFTSFEFLSDDLSARWRAGQEDSLPAFA